MDDDNHFEHVTLTPEVVATVSVADLEATPVGGEGIR